MTKQELKSIEQRNFKELKQKVAAWEKVGIVDQIAARIDEELPTLDVLQCESVPREAK